MWCYPTKTQKIIKKLLLQLNVILDVFSISLQVMFLLALLIWKLMVFVYFTKSSPRTLFPALQKLRWKYVKSKDMQIVLPEGFMVVL